MQQCFYNKNKFPTYQLTWSVKFNVQVINKKFASSSIVLNRKHHFSSRECGTACSLVCTIHSPLALHKCVQCRYVYKAPNHKLKLIISYCIILLKLILILIVKCRNHSATRLFILHYSYSQVLTIFLRFAHFARHRPCNLLSIRRKPVNLVTIQKTMT